MSYTLCGVESWTLCFCDSQLQTPSGASTVASDPYDGCNMTCEGYPSIACGGLGNMNVYSATIALNIQTAATTTTVATPSGYSYLGCMSDSTAGLLTRNEVYGGIFMDPAYCCDMCLNADNGNIVCGVESETRCYCDYKTAATGALPADTRSCDMPCAGHPDAYCGGSYRMNLYQLAPQTASATRTASSGGGGAGGPSTTNTSANTPPADTTNHHGLHGGAIAGVVIGALVGIAVLDALGYFLVRRRKKRNALQPPPELHSDAKYDAGPGPHQLPTYENPVEVDAAPPPAPAPKLIYELQGYQYQPVPREPRAAE